MTTGVKLDRARPLESVFRASDGFLDSAHCQKNQLMQRACQPKLGTLVRRAHGHEETKSSTTFGVAFAATGCKCSRTRSWWKPCCKGSRGYCGIFGHYAYAGGFHGSFYWGGFGFGFSFGWPYYAYPAYSYYGYYPSPYYRYYGYPCWWVSTAPYVWGAPPPVPPARGVPSQPPGSNSPPPAQGAAPQPPASRSAPNADADGQWHKFGESNDTPSPQGNTVLASVRTNNLASVPRSRRPDGEWHRFGESHPKEITAHGE
jgi:hypothetical protein